MLLIPYAVQAIEVRLLYLCYFISRRCLTLLIELFSSRGSKLLLAYKIPFKWFCFYLFDHFQPVYSNDAYSKLASVCFGVP